MNAQKTPQLGPFMLSLRPYDLHLLIRCVVRMSCVHAIDVLYMMGSGHVSTIPIEILKQHVTLGT